MDRCCNVVVGLEGVSTVTRSVHRDSSCTTEVDLRGAGCCFNPTDRRVGLIVGVETVVASEVDVNQADVTVGSSACEVVTPVGLARDGHLCDSQHTVTRVREVVVGAVTSHRTISDGYDVAAGGRCAVCTDPCVTGTITEADVAQVDSPTTSVDGNTFSGDRAACDLIGARCGTRQLDSTTKIDIVHAGWLCSCHRQATICTDAVHGPTCGSNCWAACARWSHSVTIIVTRAVDAFHVEAVSCMGCHCGVVVADVHIECVEVSTTGCSSSLGDARSGLLP